MFKIRLARIISNVFSPLLVPTYGVWLALTTTYLAVASTKVRWGVTAATFIITCVFPGLFILALWKLGKLSDPGLNKRTERTVPYLITIASYIGFGVYLWSAHAPIWLVMFAAGAALSAVVATVVNRWWKISAHMTAMGGLMALVCRIAIGDIAVTHMLGWAVVVAMLCGAVGSARLILNRHTPLQVAAGFANGFICVFLLSLA